MMNLRRKLAAMASSLAVLTAVLLAGCQAPAALAALESLPVRFTAVIPPEGIRTAALK